MRTTRNIIVALAALSLLACKREEPIEPPFEGNGEVVTQEDGLLVSALMQEVPDSLKASVSAVDTLTLTEGLLRCSALLEEDAGILDSNPFAEGVETKAGIIAGQSLGIHVFKVSGSAPSGYPLVFDEPATSVGGSSTNYTVEFAWPGAVVSSLRVFGVSWDPSRTAPSYAYNSFEGGPKYTVTVDPEVGSEVDLLVGVSDADYPGTGTGVPVSMSFRHIMSRVDVSSKTAVDLANVFWTPESVTFRNIYTAGTYNQVSDTWSATTKASRTASLEFDPAGYVRIAADEDFYMIPQTLPSDASVEFVFRYKIPAGKTEADIISLYGSATFTVSASIGGKVWAQGRGTRYSVNSIYMSTGLDVAPLSLSVGPEGASGLSLSLFSAVPWVVKSSPSWLSIAPTRGGRGNASLSVNINANEGAARSGSIVIGVDPALAGTFTSPDKTVSVNQTGDYATAWTVPTVSLSYTPTSVGAGGGTYTPTVSYSQTITYKSGRSETITSGATLDWSVAGTGFSIAGDGKVTAGANEGAARNGTVTLKVTMPHGESKTVTATLSQSGDSPKSYSDINLNVNYGTTSFNAAGGSVLPSPKTATQTVTYYSGRTQDVDLISSIQFTSTSPTVFAVDADGKVAVGQNTGVSARSATVTAKVSANGKTAEKAFTFTQSADRIVSATVPVISFSYTNNRIPAAGGSTAAPNISATQSVTYESGKVENNVPVPVTGYSCTGGPQFSVSAAGIVTALRNASETELSTVVTVTASGNGQTNTATATVYQDKDTVTGSTWVSASLSYSPSSIGAAGGTSTPTVSYKLKQTWASGNTTEYTSGASLSYTVSGTGFSVDAASGKVTAVSNQGSARTGTVTLTISLRGQTKTVTASVSQDGDSVTSYGTPVITLSYNKTSFDAAGGTATPTYSATQRLNYASGRYEDINLSSGWNFKCKTAVTGFSVNASNGVVSVSPNQTSSDRSVVIVATVTGQGSKSASKEVTISQTKDAEKTYGAVTVTLSYDKTSFTAASGSATVSSKKAVQEITWVSGKIESRDISSNTWSFSGDNAAMLTVNSTTGAVSVSKNETSSSRTGKVTASVTGYGSKTGSASVTFTQAANAVSSYGDIELELAYGSYAFTPAGGSIAATSCKATQVINYSNGTSSTQALTVSLTSDNAAFTVAGDGKVTVGANTTLSERKANITASASGGGKTASKTVTFTQAADYVTALTVTGGENKLTYATLQLKATASWASGKSATDVTSASTWAVDNSSLASVTAGLVSAKAAGTVTVTATYQGVSGTKKVMVNTTGLNGWKSGGLFGD